MHPVCRLLLVVFTLSFAPAFSAVEKPRITSQDQLPRFSYPLTGKVAEVATDDAAYQRLADAVRRDYEKLLQDYEIADRATLVGVLTTLLAIEVHAGNYDAASARIAEIRRLEEKPAAKLTAGLLAESYIAARRRGDYSNEQTFRQAFGEIYAARLAALPWEVVADTIKQTKAGAEIVTSALVLGNLESQYQTGVDKTGAISGDVAEVLIAQRTNLAHYLPLKQERIAALSAYVQAHQEAKTDIWAARQFELAPESKLAAVTVGIWDSGVDFDIYSQQQWANPAEQVNGRDDDGNGFVDDVHGIAYDLHAQVVPELLFPLSPEQRASYPSVRNLTKGLLDLQANIDSPEAGELRQHLARLQPADVKPFFEEISLFGNFTHGTHVAGIAAAGNPAVRLLGARITFDHHMIPELPTREQAERDAAMSRAVVAYFKQHGVRVVNMSWGGSPRDIEAAFEANGAGGTPDERRKTARDYFELSRTALTEAMRDTPEILFVAAAGNSDSDASFDEFIPSGIDLPNILTVGAVDQAGEETSFTSFGRNVDVHACGFEVESYLPGGERMKYSGTSMAAPNVTNLAAKLLALDSSLSVEQVIELIKLGADRSADGRINLINPKRSVALLKTLRES